MQHFFAEFKDQNMPNIMVLTYLNTTDILCSIAKVIASLIPLDWKPSRMNLAPTPSNASTVKMTTKQTLTFVFSKSIGLIANSIQKNTKKSVTLGNNWFVQLWMVTRHDCEKHQDIFAKCSQEQLCHQHNTWNPMQLQYHLHPRTILVSYALYSKFKKQRRVCTSRNSKPSKLDYFFQKPTSR